MSLSPVKDTQLFTLFNTSYKEFKINFFKVSIMEASRFSFYSENNRLKFPFYWTEHPKRVISRAKSAMTLDELDAVGQLNQLPRKTSSRTLIGFLGSNTLCTKVFGKLLKLVFIGLPFMTYLNFLFCCKFVTCHGKRQGFCYDDGLMQRRAPENQGGYLSCHSSSDIQVHWSLSYRQCCFEDRPRA